MAALEMPLVSAYVHEVCGIVLEPSKAYLVESRLGPLAEREGLTNYAELIRRAREDATGRLRTDLIDAVATNETSFFRDERPFDLLVHKLVPDVFEQQSTGSAAGKPRLDVWSAASATGQEVYSLAIALHELLWDLSRFRVRIVGTDISDWALASASRGWYSSHEVARGLSERRLQRFFVPQAGGWRVRDELRAMATFARQNLLERFGHLGTFHIILCRNVAIYLSLPNRRSLFDRLADQLPPDGVLIIGASESLEGITQRFARDEFRGSIFYRRVR